MQCLVSLLWPKDSVVWSHGIQHDARVPAKYDDCLGETIDTILEFSTTQATTFIRP